MNEQMEKFDFEKEQIRIVQSEDGEPYFVASDVARALGYSRPDHAVSKHCNYVSNWYINQNGRGTPNVKVIPESDVYRLITQAAKWNPKAKKFERWVYEDVLPTIRKEGKYDVSKDLPDFRNPAEAARAWADQYERAMLAESQVKELKPKADRYQRLTESDHLYNVSHIAARYGISAIKLNKLLELLSVQYKRRGTYILYSPYKNRGYVDYVLYENDTKDGEHITHEIMKWTEKGREFIDKLLKDKGYVDENDYFTVDKFSRRKRRGRKK